LAVIGMAVLYLPHLGQEMLPFAILGGGVFSYMKLARSQELVATRAAGVSAWDFLAPPLAVAIGIYLPMSATLPLTIGAIVGHCYDQRAKRARSPQRAQRLGTLVASGMIVGESLFGVILAGLIVATAKDAPLALVPAEFAAANPIGLVVFVALVAGLYAWMLRRNRAA